MSLLCDITSFRDAVGACAQLITTQELRSRGVKEIPRGLLVYREFLLRVSNEVEDSYEQLLELLQSPQMERRFSPLTGSIGKLLDAIQVLKPQTTRNDRVKHSILVALERTGHHFIWEALGKHGRNYYEDELLKATAIYQLLEVAAVVEPAEVELSRNPISTLRNSMGARLPEEYFSELLAGWAVEDAFKLLLETKGFECTLEGADRERQMQFVRPGGMGVYDFKASSASRTFYLELQRVGKLSREQNTGRIRTYLRRHKYEGGNDHTKVLILWVGEPAQQAYRKWAQKVIPIANVRNKDFASFGNEYISLPDHIFDSAQSWTDLTRATGDEILRMLGQS